MKTKLLILYLLIPFLALTQITQIGADIDGEAENNYSGYAVSLSASGNILAMGAPGNFGSGPSSGHVRVFQAFDGNWVQIGSDIDGEAEGDWSGSAISLNADGNIVAIGAWANDDNGNDSGHVRVFQNNGGDWSKMGEDMDGVQEGEYFGISLCLNEVGDVIAIGAPGNNSNGSYSGQVRVYKNIGGNWIQIGSNIDGESEGDWAGSTVSLSSDGSIVAIGSPQHYGIGSQSGQVRIFKNTAGVWTQMGANIEGDAEGDVFGYSVSLSANGTIIAIGAVMYDGNGVLATGLVRILHYEGDNWVQMGADIYGEDEIDESGWSVSLNSNGNVVAIGAVFNDGSDWDSGHVRVYQYTDNSWVQIGEDIDGEAATDQFGYSVSMNSSGNIVAIGAPENDGNGPESGHVRVFDLSSVMGISENSLGNFSLYPNPTNNVLHIACDLTIVQIQVFNVLGQLVLSNTNQSTIDISSVSQGIYFIKVKDEHGNSGTQQVVKK